MNMIEQTTQDKTVCDIVLTGSVGACLAVIFQTVRIARRTPDGKPLSWRQVGVELFGAGAVGAVVAWGLDSIGFGREVSAVIIAMSGYVGGPLLDIAYTELQEIIKAGFSGAKKWLSEAKWDKKMITDIVKTVISFMNHKKMRKSVIFITVLCVIMCFWLIWSVFHDDEPVLRSQTVVEHIQHEVERAERVIEAIDKRKEAELSAVKKESIDPDAVISTLDRLLGLRTGK